LFLGEILLKTFSKNYGLQEKCLVKKAVITGKTFPVILGTIIVKISDLLNEQQNKIKSYNENENLINSINENNDKIKKIGVLSFQKRYFQKYDLRT